MTILGNAILNLCPECRFVIKHGSSGEPDVIEWRDELDAHPSLEEIQAESDRMMEEYEAHQYARDRAKEYPPIGDQLDALWKGGDASTDMLAKVQAVKEKYPKPE